MNRWLMAAGAAAVVCVAAPVLAQPQITPVSPAAECLTPAPSDRRPVEYPLERYERKEGATLEVRLTFASPDRAPAFKLLSRTDVPQEMEKAVRDHVQQFRVPCMPDNSPPVVLKQIYDFVPNDGRKVMSSAPTDETPDPRRALWKCLNNDSKLVKPDYPWRQLRRGQDGKVYADITFSAPDQPPRVAVLAAAADDFREAVESAARHLRMPCFDGGQPLSGRLLYIFQIEDGGRLLLRDRPLVSFLKSARSYPTPAFFDFGRMGCPFDLRLSYFQPHARNLVQELETQLVERQPLMDWLSRIELNLGGEQGIAALGDTMTVSVPCGSLDL